MPLECNWFTGGIEHQFEQIRWQTKVQSVLMGWKWSRGAEEQRASLCCAAQYLSFLTTWLKITRCQSTAGGILLCACWLQHPLCWRCPSGYKAQWGHHQRRCINNDKTRPAFLLCCLSFLLCAHLLVLFPFFYSHKEFLKQSISQIYISSLHFQGKKMTPSPWLPLTCTFCHHDLSEVCTSVLE